MKLLQKNIWKEDLLNGLKQLKDQHCQLNEMAEGFLNEESSTNPRKCAKVLSELADAIVLYFKTKTNYLELYNFPDIEKYIEQDKQFILQFSKINMEFSHEVPTNAKDIYQVVKIWLVSHEHFLDNDYVKFAQKMISQNDNEVKATG